MYLMQRSRTGLGLFWAALSLVIVSVAADSVPIGCYKYDPALHLKAVEGEGTCSQKALASKLTVWGELDGACYATIVVPAPALKQNATSCEGTNIALHYWMEFFDAAEKWTCVAEALPLTEVYWVGLETVEVADGVATLTINGAPKTVAKFYSKRKTGYGIYSADMAVPGPQVGGVTAMYTTTQDQAVKEQPPTWDEVDYEILNECGDKGCTPASGWANTFKDGTNSWEGKTWGKVMWNDATVLNKFHRYSFSWHLNNIFWYKDNDFIYEESSTDHPLPWQAQYTVFVLWYNDKLGCEYFGGCATKGVDLTLKIKNIRQLTCTEI